MSVRDFESSKRLPLSHIESVLKQLCCPECDREFAEVQAARQHYNDEHVRKVETL